MGDTGKEKQGSCRPGARPKKEVCPLYIVRVTLGFTPEIGISLSQYEILREKGQNVVQSALSVKNTQTEYRAKDQTFRFEKGKMLFTSIAVTAFDTGIRALEGKGHQHCTL